MKIYLFDFREKQFSTKTHALVNVKAAWVVSSNVAQDFVFLLTRDVMESLIVLMMNMIVVSNKYFSDVNVDLQ